MDCHPLFKQIICEPDTAILKYTQAPNIVDQYNKTPLDYAVLLGKPNFCSQLIAAGAYINSTPRVYLRVSPLTLALELLGNEYDASTFIFALQHSVSPTNLIKCILILLLNGAIVHSFYTHNVHVLQILLTHMIDKKISFPSFAFEQILESSNIDCLKLALAPPFYEYFKNDICDAPAILGPLRISDPTFLINLTKIQILIERCPNIHVFYKELHYLNLSAQYASKFAALCLYLGAAPVKSADIYMAYIRKLY